VAVDRCLLGVEMITSLDLDYEEWPAGDAVQVVALNEADAPIIALVEWNEEIEIEDDATGDTAELLDDEEAGVQWTEVGGIPYRVAADSFFQIHTRAPEVLIEAVLDGLALEGGETVLDLYAGVGLFTVPIAQAVGEHGSVLAIESSSSAVSDAQVNLEHAPWARVVEAPVTVQTLSPYLNDAVAAVVDPPRSGVDKKALAMLASSTLTTLVMVSCSPATFSRDVKVLLGEGWNLESLRALDLFEMTEHLEIVAVLRRPSLTDQG
jgi:tRNA/tmRNA/rRNA uracil-C5-methylase (TrmA/RlmC/RlmD family)